MRAEHTTTRIHGDGNPRRSLPLAISGMLLLGVGSACTLETLPQGVVITVDCEGDAPCRPKEEETPPPEWAEGAKGTIVTLSDEEISLPRGGRTSFTATVTPGNGVTDDSVVWIETGGHVDANGNYTAPNTPGTYYVIARSIGDPLAQAVAKVDVRQVWVTLSPKSARVQPGRERQFVAHVTGTDDHRVAWSIVEGSGSVNGVIHPNGIYEAPEQDLLGAPIHVQATSVADTGSTARVKVYVESTPANTIEIFPKEATLELGEVLSFSVDFTLELEDPDLDWSVERIDGESTGGAMVSEATVIGGHSPGLFRVRATARNHADVSATALIRVVEPALSPLKGLLRATGESLTNSSTLLVAGLSPGTGVTTRKGPGLYRIRGNTSALPAQLVSWIHEGIGLPTSTSSALSLMEHLGGDSYATVDMPPSAAPWPASDISARIPEMPLVIPAGPGHIAVIVPALLDDGWPGAGYEPHAVDEYRVKLADEVTFASPASKDLPADRLVVALFEDEYDPQDTIYVKYTGVRGEQESLESSVEEAGAPPGSRTISGTVDLRNVVLGAGAKLFILSLPSGAGVVVDASTPEPAFTLDNVSPGLETLHVFLDSDANGIIDVTAGDRRRFSARSVFVPTNANVTGVNVPGPRGLGTVTLVARRGPTLDLHLTASATAHPILRASLESAPTALSSAVHLPRDFGLPSQTLSERELLLTVPSSLPNGSAFRVNLTTSDHKTISHYVTLKTPSAPMNLNVTPTPDVEKPEISWQIPWGTAHEYVSIELKPTTGTVTTIYLEPMTESHSIIGPLDAGETYVVRVSLWDGFGNSGYIETTYQVPEEAP